MAGEQMETLRILTGFRVCFGTLWSSAAAHLTRLHSGRGDLFIESRGQGWGWISPSDRNQHGRDEGVGDSCCPRALPAPDPFLFPLPVSILSTLLGPGEPPRPGRGPAIVEPSCHFPFPSGRTWQHLPEAACQSGTRRVILGRRL